MSFDVAKVELRVQANQLLVDENNRLVNIARELEDKATLTQVTGTETEISETRNVAHRALVEARLAFARLQVMGELSQNPYRATAARCRAFLWDLREELNMNPPHALREQHQ